MPSRNGVNKNGISQEARLGLVFWIMCLYFLFQYARPHDMIPALAAYRIPLILTLLMPILWFAKGDKRALKDPLIILYGFLFSSPA
ncbi:hypothetical protein CAI21_19875 [Alkalilimnicola ehrlichii]|uniref:Uncharacterized protein n=1 Tax=Alkalilimnicola ehrlichii TaxID=351052 RepID=A0A3E0WI32_9GAMM|nr:hypothetical protein [Alkalilimnicola ehrlichii]RFA25155.1 hypothetical protein CAI21_19875 [Alkalilimnicola ehrlichii]RFA32109.1 hypothetical protein CAL65_20455 [Alkalilimnicola ehrlichii]